ncbi:hypothetical protein [uncultured Erythrobacter sp.]|uniref:hypothetical protein n=1 Tax=uncultured Erythrobacter sp. TaxID=263913 RepID=UPI00261E45CE|nr:hypothetical protein [uncultured Erythrobacter sp.]
MRLSHLLVVSALSVAACSAHAQPPDLVRAAADAIVAQDAAALEAMRFSAYDLDRKPLTVEGLLGRIAQCQRVERRGLGREAYPKEIHFQCSDTLEKRGACDDDVLIVALDRATSPDVFAQLRFKRLETAECALPKPPTPLMASLTRAEDFPTSPRAVTMRFALSHRQTPLESKLDKCQLRSFTSTF